MVIRTAERRNAAGAVLCFLEGAYLAMLCFAVLPSAMGTARFWGAAGCAAAGCGTGLLAEKYLPWDVLLRRALFLFLTAAVCFSWEIPVFPLAFLGGVGLYHASAGILPEPVSIRKRTFQRRRLSCGSISLFAAIVAEKRRNLPSLLFFGMMKRKMYRIAYKTKFL